MYKLISIPIILLSLMACTNTAITGQPAKDIQADKAQAAADTVSFTENAEIDNIQRRLELTSDPGALGFIILFNEAGQPVYYGGVVGKITSGGKRLTRPWTILDIYPGQGIDHEVVGAPSDEGTWGSSNPYVYFWTSKGQYMQWSGEYLYSDKPLRLTIEPVVINLIDKTE